MTFAENLLHLIALRAQLLVPVVCVGLFIGEFLARYSGLNALIAHGHGVIATLNRKLNRPKRSVGVRVYRGIITLIVILIPVATLSFALSQPMPGLPLLSLFLLAALYGRAFATFRLLRLWQNARAGTLPLELPGGDFLFADTHAVLRHTILSSSESFAVGGGGLSFWYVLGGLPAACIYLATAAVRAHDRTPAFGWAANALFRLLDLIPRAIATLLLTFAALFTPRARPFAVARARNWQGVVAQLLNLSLGGLSPDGNLPWTGTGTPRLEATHLLRWLILRTAATILLVMALVAPDIINTLKLFV